MIDTKKIVNELYEKYGFVDNKKSNFSKIVLQDMPTDITYDEALNIGKKNIMLDIVNRIKDKKFSRLFDRTVKKIGIEETFDLYNIIIQNTNAEIDGEDIIRICSKKEYIEFLQNTKREDNAFLTAVIEVYNIDSNLDLDLDDVDEDIVKDYLKEIGKFELIKDREEELKLITKYRKTGDEKYKDEFLNRNLRLPVSVAYKIYRGQSGIRIDLIDLISEGNVGLITAFDKFDETKEYKFSTYAYWWIRQRINNCIYKENYPIRIPVYLYEQIKKINRFRVKYSNEHQQMPTDEEIMEYMNLDEEKYKRVKQAEDIRLPLSYDIPIDKDIESDADTEVIDLIPDEERIGVEDETIETYLGNQMLAYVDKVLAPREKAIMLESCGFNEEGKPKTQAEIGRKLGVTRECIRQLEVKATYKLQKDSDMINSGNKKVEPEYISGKDIKEILKEQGITTIRIINHSLHKPTSTFLCTECNNEFKTNAKEFYKNPECPYCTEKVLLKIKGN